MTTIRITGRSDDLIEVDGDISDEGSGPGFVELSTGDVFEVAVDDTGCWNVRHVEGRDALDSCDIVGKDEEDDDGYTGHAECVGDIAWVDFWREWPPDDDEVRERLADNLDRLGSVALMAAYRAAAGRT